MSRNSGCLRTELPIMALLSAWYQFWLRWVTQGKRRIPQHWPLHARVAVTSEELRVWQWLIKTFDDHHVMIKMPVARFTRPNASENGLYWYELLQNISCTFSVCADDGHIVGCVDVPKPFGLSQKARALKENLLEECGISYVVLNPSMLPNPAAIRNEFLGEVAARTRHLKREEAAVEAARISLKTTLVQQRRIRKLRAAREDQENVGGSSSMPSHWNNSFFIQSNSCPAELR